MLVYKTFEVFVIINNAKVLINLISL